MFWRHLTGHTNHPLLIPSENMKRWKEEQPMRSLPHLQEIPIFALHGRYPKEVMAQHSWIVDISHSLNDWESLMVRSTSHLASHSIPEVSQNSHQRKYHHHTAGMHQSSTQCYQEDLKPGHGNYEGLNSFSYWGLNKGSKEYTMGKSEISRGR